MQDCKDNGDRLFSEVKNKKKKQLQAAAREIPVTPKTEILHNEAGMAAHRRSGMYSVGATQNSAGQD